MTYAIKTSQCTLTSFKNMIIKLCGTRCNNYYAYIPVTGSEYNYGYESQVPQKLDALDSSIIGHVYRRRKGGPFSAINCK